MKIFDYILTKIVYPACALFTAISFSFLLFVQLSDTYNKPAIYIDSYFTFFVLSLLIALCNRVLHIKGMTLLSRTLLHAVCVIGSIVLVFYAGKNVTEVSPLVLILFFSVIYAIVAAPILLVASSRSAKKKEQKDYQSMFSAKEK